VIWYLGASLYGRNPLIANPSLPFVGWRLLAHLLIPSASRNEEARPCKAGIPEDIYLAAWIVMALAYTNSGYTKLVSPSWTEGTALSYVLTNPLARATALRTFILRLPPLVRKLATWSALGLALSFAPLALFRRLRALDLASHALPSDWADVPGERSRPHFGHVDRAHLYIQSGMDIASQAPTRECGQSL
jgi:hypothetical protein